MATVSFHRHDVASSPAAFSIASVRKRDGSLAAFDARKITQAILKAGRATGEFGEETAQTLTMRVLGILQMMRRDDVPAVEEVQNTVEETLLASPFKRTAKAYILYRDQHARNRELTRRAELDLVDDYLGQSDWRVRENSNMAYSLQGLNNYVSSEISKVYWLNKIYTPDVREAHVSGDFHLHDLGLLSAYCVGWDLRDLLHSGFQGAPGKAESRPAKHFRAALGQIVNFFYTLQGEAAGAQAFSSLDTLLAPFIRYDGLEYAEVKQALQEFIFNLNVATRVGFQTPFTNVTLDLQPPRSLRDEAVVIGGRLQAETYGDFQREMDVFNAAFLEVLAEGDAKGRVFTFPIPTYNITADFDWDAPGLQSLWRATARYGIPYFANFVNSEMSPEDARSMCCRLRLDLRALERRGGGLFGANPLTGSIGVVTINMPRLGYTASSESDFLTKLDSLMETARTSLETKRAVLERFTDGGLYPYTKFYLRGVKERYGSYWHNHFSTIGLVGMNEACLNLLGCDIGTDAGVAFAGRVLDHMRDRLQEFQQLTGRLYNLEATPAEGAAYRLARLDRRRFPAIRTADVPTRSASAATVTTTTTTTTTTTAAAASATRHGEEAAAAEPPYSNSTQLPVHYSDDIFRVLELQDPLQSRYTGGTVQHVFLGEAVPNPESVKRFVRKVCENFRLPYFTLSPTFSICPQHGYLRGEVASCPDCGTETEIYSRVVGYLRPVKQWNAGKQAEFAVRSLYRISESGELS